MAPFKSRMKCLLLWLAVGGPFLPCELATAQQPANDSIVVVSYNIHHGQGVDGKLDLGRIAGVLRGADLIALQEVDQNATRSESVDQARVLAEELGMHFVFGANIELQGGHYGNAILSRWPIKSWKNHLLPNTGGGEQRGLLEAVVTIPNHGDVLLLATHFDHRRDPQQRLDSTEFIDDFLEKRDFQGPTILAGDLNATPESQVLTNLSHSLRGTAEEGLVTVPVKSPAKQIDFILTGRQPESEYQLDLLHQQVLEEDVASDHRAIRAVLGLRGSADFLVQQIAFGSCIKQDRPTPILNTIADHKPDLMVYLGDNIYADTTEQAVMRAKYGLLRQQVEFRRLLDHSIGLATWDDHDFGVNDGGAEFEFKETAQQEFLEFWDEPRESPRWNQAGVYYAREYGPESQRLQVILLDTRYFRSPLKRGEKRVGGPYVPDESPEKTMLGEAQWKWLEEQLLRPADVRLIGTSIQCIASDAGQETWSNLPKERQRLFKLIESTEAKGVVLLSGDRHWSELSVTELASGPLYELTSSSLNQDHPRGTPTDNIHRAIPTTYHQPNYGWIEVDWSSTPPTLEMSIRDLRGQTQFSQSVRF